MTRKSLAALATLFIGGLLCGPAHPQSMYRCGNVYQDRPCEGTEGKRIGSSGTPQASTTPAVDAECAQRGKNSLKIVWSREAGASAEKQITDIDAKIPPSPRSAEEKSLIAEVFNKKGSAPEVRAAIEADCMQAKEKAAQAGARMPGAQIQPNAGQPTSGSNEAAAKAASARRREEMAAHDTANKKSRCDDLRSQLASIRNNQRSGGGVMEMERLNQLSREAESQLRDGGC